MVEMMNTYLDDIKKCGQIDLPWETLDGCNILVVGATGLIGSCLIDVLMSKKDRKYHIYAMGRNENRAKTLFSKYKNDNKFHLILHDITTALKNNIQFQYIIDGASNASPFDFSNHPVEIMRTNLLGIFHLLDYGLAHGVRRLLYVSSGEIYGQGDGGIFSEKDSGFVDSMKARSCYPSSKRAAETICSSYKDEYGIDVVVARPCHIYGPCFTEKDNRVYAQFIKSILDNQDIILKSDGTQFRSWCYVVDCVSALLTILLKGNSGEAYNIADPNSNISIKTLAEIIARIGKKKVLFVKPSDQDIKSYNPINKSVFNVEKLFSLGWDVSNSIEENIKKTIQHKQKLFYK